MLFAVNLCVGVLNVYEAKKLPLVVQANENWPKPATFALLTASRRTFEIRSLKASGRVIRLRTCCR